MDEYLNKQRMLEKGITQVAIVVLVVIAWFSIVAVIAIVSRARRK